MTLPDRKIETLGVDLIQVGDRYRDVQPDAVERLAASMEKIGLRTPISVRYYPERPDHVPAGDTDDALILMTGAHRLAAARHLGWEQIEAFVYYDGDHIDAQLWEIAENLHRADLSKDERDRQIRRYAELLREREAAGADKMSDPETDSRGQRKSPQQKPGIASKVAKETGLNVRTVRRVLSDKPQQRRPVPPSDAPRNDFEVINQQHRALVAAWEKARPEARERFLADIHAVLDRPVMDHDNLDPGDIPEFLRRTDGGYDWRRA